LNDKHLSIVNTNKITVSAIVRAKRKKAWEYYTQPEHITQWNFADPSWHCPSATNELRVGGRYFARMEAKDGSFGFDFEATYLEVTPNEKFTYEFGGRLASVEFADADGFTAVTVSFDPESENAPELQQQGWQAILNSYQQYTETHG
jgi:uncharacterized protein YndB with AHSA1/START domain